MEYEKYTLYYDIKKNSDTIRLLGDYFARNNRNKGTMIYENKRYPLARLFQFEDFEDDMLTIKILLSKNCYNKSFMFKDCSSLLYIKFNNSIYNKQDILFNSTNNIFIGNKKNEIFYDNYKWNTNISSIDEIFSNCSSLLALPDISDWDTKNIIEFNKIFYNCKSLLSLPDIYKWEIKNFIDLDGIFDNCSYLVSLTALGWEDNSVNIKEILYKFLSLYLLPYISEWKYKKSFNFKNDNYQSLKPLPNISKSKINNMNISYMFEKSSSIFKLIYEIKEKKPIKLFDSKFVRKNNRKCKMVINNKLYLLTDKYNIFNDNIKQLKIKLIILNNKGIDLNHMFYKCKYLEKFSVVQEKDIKNEVIFKEEEFNSNQKKIVNSPYSSEFDNQLYYKFYNLDETCSTSDEISKNKSLNKKNQLHIIYYKSNKNNFIINERQKLNEILNRSNDLLYTLSSIYSPKLPNNNIKEFNSFNENHLLSTISEKVNNNINLDQSKSLYDYFYPIFSLSNPFKGNNIITTDLSYIFSGCSSLISISGISNWNTNNVISMAHMFEGCSLLKNIDDISKWDTNKVINISNIFSGCSSLASLPDISKWNTNSVENMSEVFNNCSSLKSLPDISNWNTHNVYDMGGMFFNCSSLLSLPCINKWNTYKVNNLIGMFSDCSSLLSLPDISKWNTNNVYYLGGLFLNCSSLKSLPDISKWNTNKVINLNNLFSGCSSLTSLPDISKWNTRSVTEMSSIFHNCSSLVALPDISKWDICSVTQIGPIFSNCTLLKSLPDISKWNTKNNTNMNAMFYRCSS